ncbi:MAG: c-type cytochrome domain-containing protein [Verrucomicrobiota bacterium]
MWISKDVKHLFYFLTLAIPFSSYSLDYERDIMPIFVEKCAECHSNESGKVKGGFKVDDPDHLLGRLTKNSLVVPGDWDASYLFITLYRPADHDDAMPPFGKGERLTPEEVELVQQWITEGATINGVTGEKGEMPEAMAAEPEGMTSTTPLPTEWVNKEGKKIIATLLKVEDGKAFLRLPNGVVHPYPVENLSDQSRAVLEQ